LNLARISARPFHTSPIGFDLPFSSSGCSFFVLIAVFVVTFVVTVVAPASIENAAAILAHELDPKLVLVEENGDHLVKYTDDRNHFSAASTQLPPGRHYINWDIIRNELKAFPRNLGSGLPLRRIGRSGDSRLTPNENLLMPDG